MGSLIPLFIVNNILYNNKVSGQPKVIELVGGPNGSGKTTFAESFLVRTKKKLAFLNPDLIASGMSSLKYERASFQAGRILIHEIKEKIKRGDSFAFESTLSGMTYLRLLSAAIQKGYEIKIYFLYVSTTKMSLERIKKRVREGGHNIPKEIVERRHLRCFDNFWNKYRKISSDWYIFDNSLSAPSLVCSKKDFENFDKAKQSIFEQKFQAGKINGEKT
jgi:predicted ABC-type ATPase